MSVRATTFRLEAMMHALLVDHGYRLDHDNPDAGPTRRVYYHLTGAAHARLERIDHPDLAVAVTVLDERTGRPVGMAAKPERLRVLLERGSC